MATGFEDLGAIEEPKAQPHGFEDLGAVVEQVSPAKNTPAPAAQDDTAAFADLGAVTPKVRAQQLVADPEFNPAAYAHETGDEDTAFEARELRRNRSFGEKAAEFGGTLLKPETYGHAARSVAAFAGGLVATPLHAIAQAGATAGAPIARAVGADDLANTLENEQQTLGSEALQSAQQIEESLRSLGRGARGLVSGDERARFRDEIAAYRNQLALGKQRPLDTGVVAAASRMLTGNDPSAAFSPEALAAQGARPASPLMIELGAASADPTNLMIPVAGKYLPKVLAGGITQAAGKVLQAPEHAIGYIPKVAHLNKVMKTGSTIGAGVAAYEAIQHPEQAAQIAGVIALGKTLGWLGKGLDAQGLAYRTGTPSPLDIAKAAGRGTMSGNAQRLIGNTAVNAALGVAALEPVDYLQAEGDPRRMAEAFIGNAGMGAMFGLPGETFANRQQMQAIQAYRFAQHGAQQLSQNAAYPAHNAVMATMKPEYRNQINRLRAYLHAGTGTDVLVLDGQSYAQQVGAIGQNTRGNFAAADGVIYLNADSISADPLQTGRHEAGHAIVNFLQNAGRDGEASGLFDAIKAGMTPEQLTTLTSSYRSALSKGTKVAAEQSGLGWEKGEDAAARARVDAAIAEANPEVKILEENLSEIVRDILDGRGVESFSLSKPILERLTDSVAGWMERRGWLNPIDTKAKLGFKAQAVKEAARQAKTLLYETGQRASQAMADGPTAEQEMIRIQREIDAVPPFNPQGVAATEQANAQQRQRLQRELSQWERRGAGIPVPEDAAPPSPDGTPAPAPAADPITTAAEQLRAEGNRTPYPAVRQAMQRNPAATTAEQIVETVKALAVEKQAVKDAITLLTMLAYKFTPAEAKQWTDAVIAAHGDPVTDAQKLTLAAARMKRGGQVRPGEFNQQGKPSVPKNIPPFNGPADADGNQATHTVIGESDQPPAWGEFVLTQDGRILRLVKPTVDGKGWSAAAPFGSDSTAGHTVLNDTFTVLKTSASPTVRPPSPAQGSTPPTPAPAQAATPAPAAGDLPPSEPTPPGYVTKEGDISTIVLTNGMKVQMVFKNGDWVYLRPQSQETPSGTPQGAPAAIPGLDPAPGAGAPEPPEPPAPKPKGAPIPLAKGPGGVDDILNLIAKMGGIVSRKGTQEFDDMSKRLAGYPIMGGTETPEDLANNLHVNHNIGDGSVVEMWKAIDAAIVGRKSNRKQTAEQEARDKAADDAGKSEWEKLPQIIQDKLADDPSGGTLTTAEKQAVNAAIPGTFKITPQEAAQARIDQSNAPEPPTGPAPQPPTGEPVPPRTGVAVAVPVEAPDRPQFTPLRLDEIEQVAASAKAQTVGDTFSAPNADGTVTDYAVHPDTYTNSKGETKKWRAGVKGEVQAWEAENAGRESISRAEATKIRRKHELMSVIREHSSRLPLNYPGMRLRVDPFGRETVSGTLDPTRPFDLWLISESKLAGRPDKIDHLDELQHALGQTMEFDYRHAVALGQGVETTGLRRGGQALESGQDRATGKAEGQIERKVFIAMEVEFHLGTEGFTLIGASPDKLFNNFNNLVEAMEAHGKPVPYRKIDDMHFVADLKGYVRNHANNRQGDGSEMKDAQGARVEPTGPAYHIKEAKFEFLNALLGDESAKSRTKQGAEKATLAQFNARMADAESGETNPLRHSLNQAIGPMPMEKPVMEPATEPGTGKPILKENGKPKMVPARNPDGTVKMEPDIGPDGKQKTQPWSAATLENAISERILPENIESKPTPATKDTIRKIGLRGDDGARGDMSRFPVDGLDRYKAAAGFMPEEGSAALIDTKKLDEQIRAASGAKKSAKLAAIIRQIIRDAREQGDTIPTSPNHEQAWAMAKIVNSFKPEYGDAFAEAGRLLRDAGLTNENRSLKELHGQEGYFLNSFGEDFLAGRFDEPIKRGVPNIGVRAQRGFLGRPVPITLPDYDGNKLPSFLPEEAGAENASEAIKARAAKLWKEKGTESPFFKKWFGKSKVVDAQGKPKGGYHGTNVKFTEFKHGEFGFHIGSKGQAEQLIANRSEQSDTPTRGTLMEVYVKIENPLRIDDVGNFTPDAVAREAINAGALTRREANPFLNPEKNAYVFDPIGARYDNPKTKQLRELLKSKGYDGIVYSNTEEIGGDFFSEHGDDPDSAPTFPDSYIAFDPTQIKSATGNQGTFDAQNPDIRFLPEDPRDQARARQDDRRRAENQLRRRLGSAYGSLTPREREQEVAALLRRPERGARFMPEDRVDDIRKKAMERWKENYGDDDILNAPAWWIDRHGNLIPVVEEHAEISGDDNVDGVPMGYASGMIRVSTDMRLGGKGKDIWVDSNRKPLTPAQQKAIKRLAESTGGTISREGDIRSRYFMPEELASETPTPSEQAMFDHEKAMQAKYGGSWMSSVNPKEAAQYRRLVKAVNSPKKWTPEKGGRLYHGTMAEDFQDFDNGEVYLATDPNETRLYAAGMMGTNLRSRTGQPRIIATSAKPGRIKDINTAINDALENGDIGETLKEEAAKARKEGYRYLTHSHPGHASEEFDAIISLYPRQDVKIHDERPMRDLNEKVPRYMPEEGIGGYADPLFDIPSRAQEDIHEETHRWMQHGGRELLDEDSPEYRMQFQERQQQLSEQWARENPRTTAARRGVLDPEYTVRQIDAKMAGKLDSEEGAWWLFDSDGGEIVQVGQPGDTNQEAINSAIEQAKEIGELKIGTFDAGSANPAPGEYQAVPARVGSMWNVAAPDGTFHSTHDTEGQARRQARTLNESRQQEAAPAPGKASTQGPYADDYTISIYDAENNRRDLYRDGNGRVPGYPTREAVMYALANGLYPDSARVEDPRPERPRRPAPGEQPVLAIRVRDWALARGINSIEEGFRRYADEHPNDAEAQREQGRPAQGELPKGYRIQILSKAEPGVLARWTLIGPDGTGRAFTAGDRADAMQQARSLLPENLAYPSAAAPQQRAETPRDTALYHDVPHGGVIVPMTAIRTERRGDTVVAIWNGDVVAEQPTETDAAIRGRANVERHLQDMTPTERRNRYGAPGAGRQAATPRMTEAQTNAQWDMILERANREIGARRPNLDIGRAATRAFAEVLRTFPPNYSEQAKLGEILQDAMEGSLPAVNDLLASLDDRARRETPEVRATERQRLEAVKAELEREARSSMPRLPQPRGTLSDRSPLASLHTDLDGKIVEQQASIVEEIKALTEQIDADDVASVEDVRAKAELEEFRRSLVEDHAGLNSLRESLRLANPTTLTEYPRAFAEIRRLEVRGLISHEAKERAYDALSERQNTEIARQIIAEEEARPERERQGRIDAKIRVAQREAAKERTVQETLWDEMLRAKEQRAIPKIVRLLRQISRNDEAFQYTTSKAKDPVQIAADISTPNSPITVSVSRYGDIITWRSKNGAISIYRADTDRPEIGAPGAGSQGKKEGGGAQMYKASLDWAINNGKQIQPSNALSEINAYVRRTAAMESSAIQHNTTAHMIPDDGGHGGRSQGVRNWIDTSKMPEGKEKRAADANNIAQLSLRASEQVMKAVPELQPLDFDFKTGKIKDSRTGNEITPADITKILETKGKKLTYERGIGVSTAQRAILIASAIREAEGGALARPDRGRGVRVLKEQGKMFYMPEEQTETPAFKKWFRQSKVVDAQGKPKPVFHATAQDINKFERGEFGFHFGSKEQADIREQHSNRYGDAPLPVRVQTYLSLQNPLRIDDPGIFTAAAVARAAWAKDAISEQEFRRFDASGSPYKYNDPKVKELRELLKSKGYDGLVYSNQSEVPESQDYLRRNHRDRPDGAPELPDSYLVFDPTQIKSATQNTGAFDPSNPDIRFMPEDAAVMDRIQKDFRRWEFNYGRHWKAQTMEEAAEFLGRSEEQMAALNAYMSGGFAEMSQNPDHPVTQALVKLLKRMPSVQVPEIHRALGFMTPEDRDAYLQKIGAEGATAKQERAITSWTTHDPKGVSFPKEDSIALEMADMGGPHTVILTVKNPTNAKDISFGYSPGTLGGMIGTNEVLLPPGTKMKVESIRRQGDQVHVEMAPSRARETGSFMPEDASTAGAEGKTRARAAKLWKEKGTESPFFKKWFGGSKVVNDTGKPLVVWHAGQAGDVFLLKYAGDVGHHFGTKEAALRFGTPKPYYLMAERILRTKDGGDTASWAKVIADSLEQIDATRYKKEITDLKAIADHWDEMGAEAEAKIPFPENETEDAVADWEVEVENQLQRDVAAVIRSQLKDLPFDAIVYENKVEGNGEDSFIIFRSNKLGQIKSATGNQGTFDPKNPDINFMPEDTGKPGESGRREENLAREAEAAGINLSLETLKRLTRGDQVAMPGRFGDKRSPDDRAIERWQDGLGTDWKTPSVFFGPDGSGYTDYGPDRVPAAIHKNARLFKGRSSMDFAYKRGLMKQRRPEVEELTGKWTLEEVADHLGDYMELKGRTDTSNPDYAAFQEVAKRELENEGYDGAHWSYEDELSPEQYQIWNKDVIRFMPESLPDDRQRVKQHAVKVAMREIEQDMKNGTVPRTATSFGELQEHTDANLYVNDAEREDRRIGPLGKSLGWKPQDYADFTNEIIAEIDKRLSTRQREHQHSVQVGDARMTDGPQEIRMPRFLPEELHHGTPHEVDSFTTKKIGTGEGAQAYGWGLYFAQSRAVAKDYAKKLGGEYTVALNADGSPINTEGMSDAAKKLIREATNTLMVKGRSNRESLKVWHESLTDQKETALRWARQGENPESNRAYAKAVDEVLAATKNAKLEHRLAGNLYTVRIKPDADAFLDWDKPLSEQSEKVKAAVKKLGIATNMPGFELGGGQIYDAMRRLDEVESRADELAKKRGYSRGNVSQIAQAASEKLASLGIAGIRYKDQGSRTWKVWKIDPATATKETMDSGNLWVAQDQDTGESKRFATKAEAEQLLTSNYVIFRDEDIEITHKNGEPATPAERREAMQNPAPGEQRFMPEDDQRAYEKAGVEVLRDQDTGGKYRVAVKLDDGTVLIPTRKPFWGAHIDAAASLPSEILDRVVDGGFVKDGKWEPGGDLHQGLKNNENVHDYYGIPRDGAGFMPEDEPSIASLRDEFKRTSLISTGTAKRIMGDKPDYLDAVVDFMAKQRAKTVAGKLTKRDVAKAYLLTLSSIGAGGISPETFTAKTGMKVPSRYLSVEGGKQRIRPEEAAALWMGTKDGKAALDAIEVGNATPDMLESLLTMRDAFGRNDIRNNALRVGGRQRTLADIAEVTDEINAAKGNVEQIGKALTSLTGIAGGKIGFIKHLLGLGDTSTVDAVELNFWLTGKGSTRQQDGTRQELVRNLKERGLKNPSISKLVTDRIGQQVARLARQYDLDSEVASHIIHHWLWDTAKDATTTHKGMMEAQARYMPEESAPQPPERPARGAKLPDVMAYGRERRAWIDRFVVWSEKQPRNKPIVLADGDDRTGVITPAIGGGYRITRYLDIDGQQVPHGHMEFTTREEAVKDALTSDGFKGASDRRFMPEKNPSEIQPEEWAEMTATRATHWDSLYRYGTPKTKHPFFATDIMSADIFGSDGEMTGVHGVVFKNPLVAASRAEASTKLLGKNIYAGTKVKTGERSPEAKAILDADDTIGDAAEKAGYDAIVTPREIQVIDRTKLPAAEKISYNDDQGQYQDEDGNAIYEGIGLDRAKDRGRFMPESAPEAPRQRPDPRSAARLRIDQRGAGFANWTKGTKVVEIPEQHEFKTGEPVTVIGHHGSAVPITAFDVNKAQGIADPQERGIYFLTTKEMPERYAKMASQMGRGKEPTVTSAYLRMENPFVGPRKSFKQLRAEGYDAWIGVPRKDSPEKGVEIAVFNGNQIKSATDNSGAFDPNNPDIRFMPEAEDIERANRTARAAGAVGSKAITPRYVAETLKPGETVLNFGAGKPDASGKYGHSETIRAAGGLVTEHDFGRNAATAAKDALAKNYDTVFASNVLNVQSGIKMLTETLEQIKSSAKKRAVFNFPESPRYSDLTAEDVAAAIKNTFGSAPKKVGGTNRAPLWEVEITATAPKSAPNAKEAARRRMAARTQQERPEREMAEAN